MGLTYPKEITDCMRDCILAIFWPKKDIVAFLRNNNCTARDLQDVVNYEETGIGRAEIVDRTFARLHARDDGGFGQFRAILKSLIEWTHFDPYYFGKLKKLDEAEAKRRLTHLRQLREIRDAKVKREQEERERRSQQAVKKGPSLEELHKTYIELFQGKVGSYQERGYKLESLLQGLASREGLETSEPFKVVGEQIDGTIKLDGEYYIVEAKWQDHATASNALYHFAYKVEGKLYGRGFFVSINGFSQDSLTALSRGKSLRTILIDGGDLGLVTEGLLSMSQMLSAKVKAAQTAGRIYVDPMSLREKQGYSA